MPGPRGKSGPAGPDGTKVSKNKRHKNVAVVIELLITVVVNNYNDPISASLQGLPGLPGSTGSPVSNDVHVKVCTMSIWYTMIFDLCRLLTCMNMEAMWKQNASKQTKQVQLTEIVSMVTKSFRTFGSWKDSQQKMSRLCFPMIHWLLGPHCCH